MAAKKKAVKKAAKKKVVVRKPAARRRVLTERAAARAVESYVSGLVGQRVRKVGGDFDFEGQVRAVFTKRDGAERVVVEDDQRQLRIFGSRQVQVVGSYRR